VIGGQPVAFSGQRSVIGDSVIGCLGIGYSGKEMSSRVPPVRASPPTLPSP